MRGLRVVAARLFMLVALSGALSVGCDRPDPGSPEAVADAFTDAYFRHADQTKAKEYTAFGVTKMLDRELEDVRAVRKDGYEPTDANLDVAVERGVRSMRGERVRFAYVIRYRSEAGEQHKRADVELSQVDGTWKVVRLGLETQATPATSR